MAARPAGSVWRVGLTTRFASAVVHGEGDALGWGEWSSLRQTRGTPHQELVVSSHGVISHITLGDRGEQSDRSALLAFFGQKRQR